jgi:acyl-coenzyme A synthetase/AMP-(fatty) acid ligase
VRLLSSVTDIIKTGGHKVSALEVERVLLGVPGVAEVAVVGVADDVWGQLIAAVVRPASQTREAEAAIRAAVSDKSLFSTETRPRKLLFVDNIPKNAMGKVNKKDLVKLFVTA